MMEEKDLRIGNYVILGVTMSVLDDAHIIVAADFKYIKSLCLVGLDPIPLTEEWLIKFGFELWHENFQDQYRIDGFPLLLRISKTGCVCSGHEYTIKKLFVHELQNLYFALTGEELTLSE